MGEIVGVAPVSGTKGIALPKRRGVTGASPDRLRICMISEPLHAGVGRHLVDAVCALSERGHEIHLLYSPVRLELSFLDEIRRQPNVYCQAVPMPRAIGRRDFAAFRKIRDYVQAEGPFDVIHGHSAKGGAYARLLRLSGFAPILYSPHAFITQSPATPVPKRILYGILEFLLARLTHRVLCVSRAERKHAGKLGISGKRLTVIANGADAVDSPSREAVRARLGFAPDQIIVGFVGRMDEQKAPERLVAAARLLLPEQKNLTFLMIGDGPKRVSLEASLRQAGLSERVLWLGAVNARDYMPGFDIFVLPSLYEGLPYVLIEALHASLPIVCTPVGGTQETVAPETNGIIVPHGASAQLAEAIRRLTNDHGLRRAMAAASRDQAENFSIGRMVDAIEDLYFDVLAESAPLRRAKRDPLNPSRAISEPDIIVRPLANDRRARAGRMGLSLDEPSDTVVERVV